ncbi:MAG: potassium channel protein [Chitinophagaceae bacterium]|nr:potassium channel protein [Chitinophagaceae bacterium]MBK7679066.1 potassium channel protein [Chitinophagaceae bacterium]MBK8299589.1 potassium channel protein [Chitinophagaceae bacterium]MBK9463639.1 potassium channel protein [Chitinophagaceae bacterium]MBK9659240.1 potassium channel protein [Chitinophagaceae bacterium]
MRKSTLRLLQPFIVLHVIILTGIVGYMVIENASFVDSLFMTTISITTVGYGEVVPLSEPGKWFTIFLLITSWGTFAFAITRITQFVVSGEINKYFKTRKLMKDIARLDKHVILCGYGRNGHQAAQVLKAHDIPFIVIEKDEQLILKKIAEGDDILHLEGDGTDDDLLRLAGVERARALITTLPLDAENVFIVLSARSLNPDIQIISRASEATSVPKLKKAGANNVIMPDRIGGSHMATLVSKPDVVEFIDFLSGEQGQSIHMESVAYDDLPEDLKGKTLRDVMNWNKTGVNCIGIKDPLGKFLINPPDDTAVIKGMKVMLLGTRHQIMQLKGNLK